jgi:undecaprenyl diphosphate synthase
MELKVIEAKQTIPNHVAIIMDGNGRYALGQKKPRIYGHKLGVDAVIRTIKAIKGHGVNELSLFAFSIENQQRPVTEVSGLMQLLEDSINKFKHKMIDAKIQLNVIGQLDLLPDSLRGVIANVVRETSQGTELKLNILINYSGQWHIAQAVKYFAGLAMNNREADPSFEQVKCFFEKVISPVDLMIRTGHVSRISNFLLWHLSYAELHWAKCYWPEFDACHLQDALTGYSEAARRFGKLSTVKEAV